MWKSKGIKVECKNHCLLTKKEISLIKAANYWKTLINFYIFTYKNYHE